MSTSIYPVPNAVIPATTTVQGIVQLAGDLGGTASSPTVVSVADVTVGTLAVTNGGTGTTTSTGSGSVVLSASPTLTGTVSGASATWTGEDKAADFKATGLTGATAASRYVGATASGAPITGTFAVGDYIVDQSGKFYVCTAAGTPGTWTQVGSTNATQLQGTNISSTAPTSNQVLAYNSGTSAWTPTTASSGLSAVSGNITTANFANATIPASTFVSVSAAQNGLFTVINGQKDFITANSLKGFSTITGDTSLYIEPGSSSLPSSFNLGANGQNVTWYSIGYGNGKFVEVANGSDANWYTTNGINWTSGNPLPSSTNWRSVVWGNGTWVAVAFGPTTVGAYSSDGITWTGSTMPSSSSWQSVVYGNGKYVAVAQGPTTAGAYSSDGITWTASTMPSSSNWWSVTYGNGKYLAISNTSSTTAAYSIDGTTWTASTLPVSRTWSAVAYGNGKYVAVANGGTTGAAYSTDGINWTSSTLPSSSTWTSVVYGNGTWVAVASGSSAGAYSSDGITWTASSMPSSSSWQSIAYGNGVFVSISPSYNVAYCTITLPKPTPFTILPVNITTNY